MTHGIHAMVLAAGQGTRMRSQRPKPLHLLCGRPMLFHVLDALSGLDVTRTVVVVGHGAERVTKKVQNDFDLDLRIEFVEQRVQSGTGDAVLVGLTGFNDVDIDDETELVVVPGDTPLLTAGTLRALIDEHRASNASATLLTARIPDPTGYGRVVRGRDGRVARIVEQADATPEEALIDEVNTSIYCFRLSLLGPALRRLTPENAQGEYYLTDVVGVLHDAGLYVGSVVTDVAETQGVNDRVQLAAAEAVLRARINERWMRAGVTMIDPTHTYIDSTVSIGRDVTLFPGSILQGRTVIGDGCEIGHDCRLVYTVVGTGCQLSYAVATDASVGSDSRVGPYAVLEPGIHVTSGSSTGSFYTGTG